MALRIGDRVDALTLLRPDGTPVALSAFAGKVVLLIFLRHLA
jgi:peroxiredoxin